MKKVESHEGWYDGYLAVLYCDVLDTAIVSEVSTRETLRSGTWYMRPVEKANTAKRP